MRRLLSVFAVAGLLAGCASTPQYRQQGEADYYYERGYAAVPDYIAYSSYYSALWPTYYHYYDPFWSPHFHYGVTWFPQHWAGFGYGYGGWSSWSYSPWYGSWWDSYYDWTWWEQQQQSARTWQRFGSARNEAAAVAALRRDAGAQRRLPMTATAVRAEPAPDTQTRRYPVRQDPIAGDESRQDRTGVVDPYYGVPRVRRGEADGQRVERAPRELGARSPRDESAAPSPLPRRQDGSPPVRDTATTRAPSARSTPSLPASPRSSPVERSSMPSRAPTSNDAQGRRSRDDG